MNGCTSTSTVMEYKMMLTSLLLSFGGGLVLGWYNQELFGKKHGLVLAMIASFVWSAIVTTILK